jgi:2',3'-cyclic-nucleotide 2'-phosphodiesterase (5'-nucleotidase family)
MRLTILHFNDVHGRLEQLPRLFTLIRRERAAAEAAGRRVLVLDGGDSSDRARWESDVTKGRANYSLLEAMGVEATVIGNGEALHWGRSALARLVGSVNYPVLAANLVEAPVIQPAAVSQPAGDEQLAVPGLRATTMLELNGFKLGVVGVTQVYPGHYDRYGFKSAHPAGALRRAVDDLRAQGARQVLLLSHLGCPTPPESKAEWPDPTVYTDDDAARDFPEIGLIVGGHSHTPLHTPLVMHKSVVAQAGHYGEWLGRLDVELDDATGALTAHTGWLIPCGADVPLDPTIQGTLELVQEEAGRLLEAVVGRAERDLPHGEAGGTSVLANWVADALRETCAADLAIWFSGFAYRGLPAGPITRRDLYQALPGATHVSAAEVSGAQIRRMVERMLRSPYRTQSINPQRNAPPLGLPAHSANVRLRHDVETGELLGCEVDGQPLEPARRYRLASTLFTLNNVRDDPEYDYIGLEPGQTVVMIEIEKVLWEVVEGWMKRATFGLTAEHAESAEKGIQSLDHVNDQY